MYQQKGYIYYTINKLKHSIIYPAKVVLSTIQKLGLSELVMYITNKVGDIVAIAEPSGGLAGAWQVDAVVGLVGPGDLLPFQVVVVAHV